MYYQQQWQPAVVVQVSRFNTAVAVPSPRETNQPGPWSSGVFKFSCPNAGLRHTWYDIDQAIDQVYLWADCYTSGGTLTRSEIRLSKWTIYLQ